MHVHARRAAEDRGCLKSYARIFRFLFARLTLMLGSQMRQSRREGAPMTGDDEKDRAKRVEPARPSEEIDRGGLETRRAASVAVAVVLVAG